ncbi:MAG: metalloregulator ArsR/SmtB family transcription factor [bacterium]|nr:metalloregulator ArsR/SmtB family transcription factor [bacterium]
MKLRTLTKSLEETARLLSQAGEPTRIRILCLLYEQPGVCVNEIADTVGVSAAVASHHLQAMKESGLLVSERHGQTICYRIQDSDFSRKLKSLMCE